jgi:hypothetical protein
MHFSGESIHATSWWLDEMMWRLPGDAAELSGVALFWVFTGSSAALPGTAAAKSDAERARKAIMAVVPGGGFIICILNP